MDWSIELEGLLRNHTEFLKRIIKDTGVMQNVFSKDATQTAYYLGVQSVGQDLCSKLAHYHPERFAQLMSEVYSERNS